MNEYDEHVKRMSEMLDAAGAADRASAGEGFERRMHDAIRRDVLDKVGQPIAISRGRSWALDRRAVAAAASVLIVTGTAVTLVMNGPQRASPPAIAATEPDDDVNEFIDAVSWMDDAMPEYLNKEEGAPNLGTMEEFFDDAEMLGDQESI